MLSRDEDRSREINGVGFNKYDSKEIHNDFEGRPDVPDDILIKHAYRLRKYENQLIGMGFDTNDLFNALDDCKPRNANSNPFECGVKQEKSKGLAGRPNQPEYRKVNLDGIPDELKKMKAWAVWKSVPNPEKSKPDKVPFSYQVNPVTGIEEIKLAYCNRPNEWMTFEDAVRLKKSNRAFKGFQVALLPSTPTDDEDRLIGVDIDKAFLPDGTIKPEYLEWIGKFNTYFELSPGADINGGVRGFCFGHFPTFGGKHQGDVEIYQNDKWLTITGQKLANSPATINNSQETIETFRA
jgi:hypothetical protein